MDISRKRGVMFKKIWEWLKGLFTSPVTETVIGKNELLAGDNLLRRELYKIPDTNNSVWMREMTTEHMLVFRNMTNKLKINGVKNTTPEQDIEIMTTIISFSVCDKNGVLLFDTPEEAKALVRSNFNLLMDLGNRAMELSKIKVKGSDLTSEVSANLPNSQTKSLPEELPMNSDEHIAKS